MNQLITYQPADYVLDNQLPIMQGTAIEVQHITKAGMGLIVACLLSAVSTAAEALYDVQLPSGSVVPASVMAIAVAMSGERKSTVQSMIYKAIQDYNDQLRGNHEAELFKWSEATASWKIREGLLAGAFRAAVAAGDSGQAEELAWKEFRLTRPKRPPLLKVLYEDLTPQALFLNMSQNGRNAALVTSEGGGVLNGASFSHIGAFNSLWSGSPITIDRVTRASFTLNDARLTMLAMVQPSALEAFLARRGDAARGIGLLARFLVFDGGFTQGWRTIDAVPKSTQCLDLFHQRISWLMCQSEAANRDPSSRREVIRFTPEAAAAWIEVANSIEAQIRPGERFADMGDHASKLADNIARVASILHVAEGFVGDISLLTLSHAIRICDISSNDFKRLLVPLPQDVQDAQLLDAWLDRYRHQCVQFVMKNTIRQYGPNRLREKNRLNHALMRLFEQRRVSFTLDGGKEVVCLFPVWNF